jgi:hypothetical protein
VREPRDSAGRPTSETAARGRFRPDDDGRHCCVDGCLEPLAHPTLPFCDEHGKDDALVRAWCES